MLEASVVGDGMFEPGAEVECAVVLLALGASVGGFEHFADFVGRCFLFHAANKSFALGGLLLEMNSPLLSSS